jgi:flagellar protein FliS
MQSTELFYRKTTAQGASGLGLLIALYDTLAGDLRRAAEAERRNDLEKRCLAVNHALVVIGYLEDCIERGGGGELATKLVTFYARLRRSLVEAQAQRSPDLLEQQMDMILRTRETWQTMEPTVVDTPIVLHQATILTDYDLTPTACASQGMSWSA